MPTNSPPEFTETKERVLAAAGEVFAEVGFKAATVREICDRAGANIASINYYFGGKEELYSAALKWFHSQAQIKFPPTHGLPPTPSAEQKLEAFIRAFFLRMFDPERPAWHGKLISRAMLEERPALTELVENGIRPQFDYLSEIVSELLEVPARHARARQAAASVVAQCLMHHHFRPVLVRLFPDLAYDQAFIADATSHVYEFSLGALRALASTLQASPPRPHSAGHSQKGGNSP